MTESIDKATSGGDFFIWSVTFCLLLLAVGFLAYWDMKSRKEK
ncbi:hypothetical protein [Candidatus Sulfurimonas marisnigri]|nr:hypothetical protein [Candidatus Sulfurimonas marisnigri]